MQIGYVEKFEYLHAMRNQRKRVRSGGGGMFFFGQGEGCDGIKIREKTRSHGE